MDYRKCVPPNRSFVRIADHLVFPRAGNVNLTESFLSRCSKLLGKHLVLATRIRADQCSKDFIPGYFTMLDWALNAKGAACFQVITMPESRFERCRSCTVRAYSR